MSNPAELPQHHNNNNNPSPPAEATQAEPGLNMR